jgi:threonine/homoserine/homoserine lactone efflux protein
MSLVAFLLEAVVISMSGVMAPGPVTTVVVGKGSESPHAGALVAVGHGIVEFPLMVAVFFGIGQLLDRSYVTTGIALVGGLFLLLMGLDMLRSMKREGLEGRGYNASPLVAGIVLSAANPYFLVWWATVGAALVLRSAGFGVLGFVMFAILHWLCDLLWSWFLSVLSFKGGQFFGRGFQRAVFGVCGALLIFFGGRLVVDGATRFLA